MTYLNLGQKGINNLSEYLKENNLTLQNVIDLNVSGNNLTELPELPITLEILDCSDNNLNKISKLPDNLRKYNCANNNLTWFPKLPEDINYFRCVGNPCSFLYDNLYVWEREIIINKHLKFINFFKKEKLRRVFSSFHKKYFNEFYQPYGRYTQISDELFS